MLILGTYLSSANIVWECLKSILLYYYYRPWAPFWLPALHDCLINITSMIVQYLLVFFSCFCLFFYSLSQGYEITMFLVCFVWSSIIKFCDASSWLVNLMRFGSLVNQWWCFVLMLHFRGRIPRNCLRAVLSMLHQKLWFQFLWQHLYHAPKISRYLVTQLQAHLLLFLNSLEFEFRIRSRNIIFCRALFSLAAGRKDSDDNENGSHPLHCPKLDVKFPLVLANLVQPC